jgi:hypothetical protein
MSENGSDALRSPERERDLHAGSNATHARQAPHAPAVRLRDLSDQVKADPRSAITKLLAWWPRLLDAEELLEDALAKLLGHADAGVGDIDLERVVFHCAGTHGDRASGGVVDRIREEVLHRGRKACFVALHGRCNDVDVELVPRSSHRGLTSATALRTSASTSILSQLSRSWPASMRVRSKNSSTVRASCSTPENAVARRS